MIVGVLSQKGGVGKTTLSLNLASHWHGQGKRVLVVDADPQGSALAWSSARSLPPIFPVVGMAKPSLHRDLPEIAADYDVTVIDGAPRVNDLGRAAILASDLVLIPVQPSPFDVWAADDTVQLIQEAQQFKETLKAAFAINRKIVNTAIGRDVAGAFADAPFPVLDATVSQRVLFAESVGQGLTVREIAPLSDAAREIAAMAEAIAIMNDQRIAA